MLVYQRVPYGNQTWLGKSTNCTEQLRSWENQPATVSLPDGINDSVDYEKCSYQYIV